MFRSNYLLAHTAEQDVETEFKEKRVAKKKFMSGKLSRDEKIDDPATRFKCKTYFAVLDTLITQLDERFNDFHNTVSLFSCLNPSQILEENKGSFLIYAKFTKTILTLKKQF